MSLGLINSISDVEYAVAPCITIAVASSAQGPLWEAALPGL